jgi:hypothetical protein
MPLLAGKSHELMGSPFLLNVRGQRHLDIGVVIRWEGFADDRDRLDVDPEVAVEELTKRRRRPCSGRFGHVSQKPSELPRELREVVVHG